MRTPLILATGFALAGLVACNRTGEQTVTAISCEEMMAEDPEMMQRMMGRMMADSTMRGEMMRRMMQNPGMRRMMMERMMADPETRGEMMERMRGMPGMEMMEGMMPGMARDSAR